MTIYFTATREIENDYPTGLKYIFIYRIENNKPVLINQIRSKSDSMGVYFKTSIEEVSDYLEEFEPAYSDWEIEEL